VPGGKNAPAREMRHDSIQQQVAGEGVD
jgi:hypothetical protein